MRVLKLGKDALWHALPMAMRVSGLAFLMLSRHIPNILMHPKLDVKASVSQGLMVLHRDEMAQQVTNSAVQKRVPLAKYIKAEVQSRLKPVESKVHPIHPQ